MASASVSASRDNYMYEYATTTNYGTSNDLKFQSHSGSGAIWTVTIIAFDLSAYEGATADGDATLKLWGQSSYGLDVGAYRIRPGRDWHETQSTWLIYKTSNNWGSNACQDTSTDIYSGVLDTVSINYGWNSFTIPQATLQAWLDDADDNQGLMLKRTDGSSTTTVSVNSRHAASNTPSLDFDYTESAADEYGNKSNIFGLTGKLTDKLNIKI